MSHDYAEIFQGTRKSVIAAVKEIEQNLQRYGSSGHKEAKKHLLLLSLSVLRSICVAGATPKGVHYDIYCDIFDRLLIPNVDPQASPKHWPRFLEHVRYFHYLLVDKKLFDATSRVCQYIIGQEQKLQNEDDYKIILSLYNQHLMTQRSRLQCSDVSNIVSKEEISSLLDALSKLLSSMLQCNTQLNFFYNDLLLNFVKCLIPKRTTNAYIFIATLPNQQVDKMFETFFELLKNMKMPQLSSEEMKLHGQEHLTALVTFMQYDVVDKLQLKLALRHLRACRSVSALQNDKAIGYIFTLLYYYMKIVYAQEKFSNFVRTHAEICKKFTGFFEKNGETLIEEKWFMDLVVVLNLWLVQVQQNGATLFSNFWQQMNNNVQSYVSHFELILECMKLAVRVTESKLVSWSCCGDGSIRRHIVFSYGQIALAAYSAILLNAKQTEMAFVQLNNVLTQIVRFTVYNVDAMTCMDSMSTSNDLMMLYGRIAQITRDVKTPTQSLYSITLVEQLVKIKHKFPPKDWTLLLRRAYKTAALTNDFQMAAELQSYYIVSLLMELPYPSCASAVSNQIAIFYSSQVNVKLGKCLLELWEHSESVMKPTLDVQHKRQLHWLEQQHVMNYCRKNATLINSLLSSTPSYYDYVVLVPRSERLQDNVDLKLRNICKELEEQSNSNNLQRLRSLTCAHARTLLLMNRIESQKNVSAFETKDCQEDNLHSLLQRSEFENVNVVNEMEMVKIAQEAFLAFEIFFKLADVAPISSDEAFIDWDCLLDDLASVALFLQLSGYIEFATKAWLLHYRIACTIDDSISALRALAYFCEHADLLESTLFAESAFNLETELIMRLPFILNATQYMPALLRRQQNFVLLCLCQMAYYYARAGHFSYTQMLLRLVKEKRQMLPERAGKYDVVLATIDAIKFRLQWKQSHIIGADAIQHSGRHDMQRKCLLREIDIAIDNLRDIVYISSIDSKLHLILLYTLVQELTECTANRLCDYPVQCLFVNVLKVALQMGSALRVVQMLTMWLWINLQMESVNKAQIKLRIIECVMGVAKISDFDTTSTSATLIGAQSKKPLLISEYDLVAAVTETHHLYVNNPGMEMMRKVVQLPVSPFHIDKLQLSPRERGRDLKRFLNYNLNTIVLSNSKCDTNSMLECNAILQWTYFMVGCFNARLYYLAGNFEQLPEYYEQLQNWLIQQRHKLNGSMLLCYYQNIQFLYVQHYANYLRAHHKYDKAIICLEKALQNYQSAAKHIDILYYINFGLQLRSAKYELMCRQQQRNNANTGGGGGGVGIIQQTKYFRRALDFNATPSKTPQRRCAPSGTTVKAKNKATPKSTKKVVVPFIIYSADDDDESKVNNPQVKISKVKNVETKKVTSHQKYGSTLLGEDLNVCQVIDISDASDVEKEQPIATTKLTVGKTKAGNAKKNPISSLSSGKITESTRRNGRYCKIATTTTTTTNSIISSSNSSSSSSSISSSSNSNSSKNDMKRVPTTTRSKSIKASLNDGILTALTKPMNNCDNNNDDDDDVVVVVVGKMEKLAIKTNAATSSTITTTTTIATTKKTAAAAANVRKTRRQQVNQVQEVVHENITENNENMEPVVVVVDSNASKGPIVNNSRNSSSSTSNTTTRRRRLQRT